MDKSYEPQTFETRLYAQWEASGCFKPSGTGTPYTILLPPPNVTGTLHMGHAFQHTLMDALVRYHRMRGFDTLWQMGTDHAGIATEMVVNRNLATQGNGESRDSLGRDKFIEKVWEWKQESGDTIGRQMRRMGTSGDWSREVFTMDPMPSQAVIEAFVRLYENKDENGKPDPLIYRGQRLVNWDPVLKTAISDLEVVSEEEDGFLWSISYPLSDGSGSLVVATTRPETMLGDTAVMVHPEDDRYAHLVGKTARLPLSERDIPIIADDYVDREFGTGVVKVTPAHDFNDYAVGQRHSLPMINILTPEATINANSPEKYQGLDRYEARKLVLADLESAGLLIETKKHKLQVPRGDRTGQVIEPYLTDQWFVKMDTLGARGLELAVGVDGKPGSVKFVPPNWINTYRHWMGNIQDWCISRQLWWGHRIPAWYDEAGKIYVGRDEEAAYFAALKSVRHELVEGWTDASEYSSGSTLRQAQDHHEHAHGSTLRQAQDHHEHAHGSTGSPRTDSSTGSPRTARAVANDAGIHLRQDNDVLETWFSSALWPFSTMGWPDKAAMAKRGFDRYVPSSVLVTGFDIIFFWVARMIMMTDHFTGEVPFHEVYITGLVRDSHGQKMSKSKGNVLDPIDLIDGIALDDLVVKRTTGLMKPTDAAKIEKATRKEFPEGIPAFGADALRFTFASLATHGRDIKFDLNRCEGYKNFCNKLWNAARFVLMNCEGFTASGAPQPTTDTERWVLHKLSYTLGNVEAHYAAYRFDLVAEELYDFTWNQYCDWFLELTKPALQSNDVSASSTRHTLLFVLEALLRALHPLIPFVTEEIWQNIAPKLGIASDSISTQAYPAHADFPRDLVAESAITFLQDAISQVRALRSQMNVSPSKLVPLLVSGSAEDAAAFMAQEASLKFLARIESITLIGDAEPPPSAMLPLDKLKLHIPLAGLIDLDAERARLAKEITRTEVEIKKCENKLASETFVKNAPAAVVARERARLTDWGAQLAALRAQSERLASDA